MEKTLFELSKMSEKRESEKAIIKRNERMRMKKKEPLSFASRKRKIKHIASTNTKDETSHFPTDGNVLALATFCINGGVLNYIQLCSLNEISLHDGGKKKNHLSS